MHTVSRCSKETHDPCASDPTTHKSSKETHDPFASDPTIQHLNNLGYIDENHI